jgi:hypothetical protein
MTQSREGLTLPPPFGQPHVGCGSIEAKLNTAAPVGMEHYLSDEQAGLAHRARPSGSFVWDGHTFCHREENSPRPCQYLPLGGYSPAAGHLKPRWEGRITVLCDP